MAKKPLIFFKIMVYFSIENWYTFRLTNTGIPDGWKSSRIKERVVRNILLKYLKEEKIDEILEILRNQGEY